MQVERRVGIGYEQLGFDKEEMNIYMSMSMRSSVLEGGLGLLVLSAPSHFSFNFSLQFARFSSPVSSGVAIRAWDARG